MPDPSQSQTPQESGNLVPQSLGQVEEITSLTVPLSSPQDYYRPASVYSRDELSRFCGANFKDRVTPDAVTLLYQLRDILNDKRVEGLHALSMLASNLGIDPEEVSRKANLKEAKKYILAEFYFRTYPHADSLEQHRAVIQRIERRIVEHLTGSKTCLIAFGSHACGRINSFLSDFDGIIVIDKDKDSAQSVRSLSEAGLVFSSHTYLSDLDEIAKNGRGLARLYAMSDEGVEVEFHAIGYQDVREITHLRPGYIHRVRNVPEKNELRVSFNGSQEVLLKSADRVLNYQVRGSEVYRGFFPDAICKGELKYSGIEGFERVRNHILKKNIGAALIHQGAISKLPNGRLILKGEMATFDAYMKTFYNSGRGNYSDQKWEHLEREFFSMLTEMASELKMLISDKKYRQIISPTLGDANEEHKIDTVTRKLHELRCGNSIKVIATDYDGTLHGGKHDHSDAVNLVIKIMNSRIIPVVVTARDATLRREFVLTLNKRLRDSIDLSDTPVFIATANGSSLYEIRNGTERVIYQNSFFDHEISSIIKAYRACHGPDLASASYKERMRNSANEEWQPFINEDLLQQARSNPGVWIEPSKVSLALPEDKNAAASFVENLKITLQDRPFNISWGGKGLVDVIKNLPGFTHDQSKLFPLDKIKEIYGVTDNSIVSFGDTPTGNDRGLLSLPNSFTPTAEFEVTEKFKPYVLSGDVDGVTLVHRAIKFIIN